MNIHVTIFEECNLFAKWGRPVFAYLTNSICNLCSVIAYFSDDMIKHQCSGNW